MPAHANERYALPFVGKFADSVYSDTCKRDDRSTQTRHGARDMHAYIEPTTMTDSLGRFFVLHAGAFVEPTEHDEFFARMPDGCVYALCFDGQWH